ncbi:hypothetical protein CCACVL1_27171 [Corchorus capsularis]|uniref:BED-type domain-containing protein n=1 Tax=Corchorus capsularis TaxID=210143 RepID=A0A1R3GBW6_COCAP|nr:hypothetical protein CCACVL1_27171 [Corchorus capsularis]
MTPKASGYGFDTVFAVGLLGYMADQMVSFCYLAGYRTQRNGRQAQNHFQLISTHPLFIPHRSDMTDEKRDPTWEFGTGVGNGNCNYCQRHFTSINRLKHHLAGFRQNAHPCQQCPRAVALKCIELLIEFFSEEEQCHRKKRLELLPQRGSATGFGDGLYVHRPLLCRPLHLNPTSSDHAPHQFLPITVVNQG